MKNGEILRKSIIQTTRGFSIILIVLILMEIIRYFSKLIFNYDLPLSKDALSIGVVILVTIGTAMYVYNSEKADNENEDEKKQKDLLNILLSELKFLEGNLKAYKETFSKEKHYPLYELWKIDISLYFNRLSHEIKGHKTINLLENLMKIKDKIIILNNLKEEARNLEYDKENKRIIEQIGAIKIVREEIIKVIDNELIPIIKKSKKILKDKFDIED